MFVKSLPNVFTIANLFLGIVAIIFAFNMDVELAALMVIIAMLTDGLDGRVARALNVQSEFGKELDSLSDVISFGVAPAFIMYVVAFQDLAAAGWVVTAAFPICGAMRLARFNVVTSTPGYFIGLPIPAAGGVLCLLALFEAQLHPLVLLLVTLGLAYLMVSNVKYPSFKRIGITKRMVSIVCSVLLVIGILALFLDFGQYSKYLLLPLALYALYGLKKNVRVLFRKSKRKKQSAAEEEALEIK